MMIGTVLTFAIVWTGLVWGSALLSGRSGRADWSGWWALHLAAAIVPVAGLVILTLLPPLFPGAAITIPADLSFLQGDNVLGAGGSEIEAGQWAGLASMALPLIAGVYALVASILLVRFVYGQIVLHRIVKKACPVFVSASGVPVLVTTETITPFATGGLRPVIVIPVALLEEVGEAGIEPVIEHEASHIARRDPDLSMLFTLASILIWPSPFVGSLARRWRLSAELQCDRAALAGACQTSRKRYARTLLAALRITADGSSGSGGKAATGRALPCPPAAFSTSQLKDEKMRMLHIMQGGNETGKGLRRGASLWLAAGVLAVAGTGAMLVADGQVVAAPADSAAIVEGGTITSSYGMRDNPQDLNKRQHHNGVDIKAPMGTPVYAPADGVIIDVTEAYKGYPAYGKVIVMQSDGGVTTVFAHLGEFNVENNQTVSRGQKIAEIGVTGKSTGPHVHVETYIDGEMTDPATIWAGLGK